MKNRNIIKILAKIKNTIRVRYRINWVKDGASIIIYRRGYTIVIDLFDDYSYLLCKFGGRINYSEEGNYIKREKEFLNKIKKLI